MNPIPQVVLQGAHVRLEPLTEAHYPGMKHAADDASIWEFTIALGHRPHFDAWWRQSILGQRDHSRVPFAVISQIDDEILGSTSFLNLALDDDRLEIGNTWYARRYWATQVNPECKLLLLAFAFEELSARRVEFCVDAINQRSRAAVAKLGAVQEGILRSHRLTQTGRIRDTVYYSILKNEWPAAKERLVGRLTG
jgi:RimJ/RimL family protein N-acetyltransferase